jgi:hypothetical protein
VTPAAPERSRHGRPSLGSHRFPTTDAILAGDPQVPRAPFPVKKSPGSDANPEHRCLFMAKLNLWARARSLASARRSDQISRHIVGEKRKTLANYLQMAPNQLIEITLLLPTGRNSRQSPANRWPLIRNARVACSSHASGTIFINNIKSISKANSECSGSLLFGETPGKHLFEYFDLKHSVSTERNIRSISD